jgi:hypothetical protein
VAEARETIRQERGEEQLLPEESERERGTSREGPAEPNADNTLFGKTHDVVTPLDRSTANGGPIDASDAFTKTREQEGDHAESFAKEAVSGERAAEDAHNVTSHEAAADEGSKEVIDENGEEVVEAAEDTVIY